MPVDTIVIRLAPERQPFFDNGNQRPPPGAFDLSSRDKQSSVPLASVYDRSKTTVDQANAMMPNPDDPRGAYELRVADVRAIKIKIRQENGEEVEVPTPLDIVDDPIPDSEPNFGMPGADGHCGISGLAKVRGRYNDTEIRNRLRGRLVSISKRIA